VDQEDQVVQFYLVDHCHLVHHVVHVRILVPVAQLDLVDLSKKENDMYKFSILVKK
jgi:hypothetical protein